MSFRGADVEARGKRGEEEEKPVETATKSRKK